MGEQGASERGQGTVEWIGLLLLVALLLLGLLAATGARLPATDLARAIVARLICAAALSDSCSTDRELVAAYGPELAARVEDNAPRIIYEDGMTALPVDFRSCRGKACGNGPDSGAVWESDSGERAAAFVHAVDCRDPTARAESAAHGFDCSGGRAGNLYLQYWLYYEDSTSLRDLPGSVGHHEDDWESYQVRIRSGGTDARASSHHGYNYSGGPGSWPSDAGLTERAAWGPTTGHLYVSGGSHAGHVHEPPRFSPLRAVRAASRAGARLAARGGSGPRPSARPIRARFTIRSRPSRWTPADRLGLVPIESLDAAARRARFAIVAPWRKPVFRDPEDEGT